MSARSLLAPLVPLYRLGLALRERRLASGREPIRGLRFPVVSIGNLSAGGSGKTPLTIALARALAARGFAVDVLSRGYGRVGRDPARVRPDGAVEEFGDEPILIAREADVPVYVAAQRYEAGVLAESALADEGPSVHLLDDGFQHRQLYRDIDMLILNRADWQDRLLPAGNLREALRAAMRADTIAIPATEPELEADLRAWGWQGPIWRLHRKMSVVSTGKPAPVVAFCGIARPEQYFAGLERAGIPIAARMAFPDHHRFTARDLRRIERTARACGATALLTTQKDAIRLESLRSELPVCTAGLRIEIEDEAAALDWLASRLSLRASSSNPASAAPPPL